MHILALVGLANPVGDITITPKVQNGITQELHVSWTPPVQRGGVNSLVYNLNLYYTNLFGESELLIPTIQIRDGSSFATVQLEDRLQFRVYLIEVLIYKVRLSGRKAAHECIDTKIPCKEGNMQIF